MTATRTTPGSTYRIQVQPGFTFADTAEAVPYLAELGVTHLHLSPVLEAVPGSRHGYDVVDHTRVRAELGGEDGLRALSRTARGHGLGLVLDIVPNHMAVPAPEYLNAPLWAVLRDGPSSPYASWFDVDWDALGGKVLLPVLGDPAPQSSARGYPHDVLAATSLSVVRDRAAGGKVLRYYDHRFPLRAGTEDLPLPELLARQFYRLAYWRAARTDLNYRRFFTISDLIAVRVEHPEVFAATHATVLRLLREDVVDGLRIDHPDGLADPAGYLRRLAEASGGRWTVVEKILQRDEALPADWACAGSTGYDALDRLDGLFTDPAGAAELADFYREYTGAPDDRGGRWQPTVRRAAYRVVTHDLAAEVSRLARTASLALDGPREPATGPGAGTGPVSEPGAEPAAQASREAVPEADGGRGPGCEPDGGQLAEAIRELLVRVPVYRPYVVPGAAACAHDTAMLTAAAEAARAECRPALGPALEAVRDLALGRAAGRRSATADGPAPRSANGSPAAPRRERADGFSGVPAGGPEPTSQPAPAAVPAPAGGPEPAPAGVPAGRPQPGSAAGSAGGSTGADTGATGRVGRKGLAEGAADAAADFAVRFAQVASALHAKSVEDTGFYRYTPLLSLCEVGRDPGRPATGPEEFHAYCARIARERPATGTVLSTHDTKRSADVRLRLAVLSEMPQAWRRWLGERRPSRAAPDPHTAYTVFQTALGLGFCHPDRLIPAALKAVREAGLRTTWTEQDEAYEKAVTEFTDQGPCGAEVYDIGELTGRLEPYTRANILGAALLHLTMPGVPDVYQGTEFPVFTLVDPDNRGPLTEAQPGTVRFDLQGTLRAALDGGPPRRFEDAKLRLTAVALRLRRNRPQWYGPQASYEPLTAQGPGAAHCVAYVRGAGALTAVTRLSRRLEEAGGWRETVLPLPPGRWTDRLGGGRHEGAVAVADLFAGSPVALLTREA